MDLVRFGKKPWKGKIIWIPSDVGLTTLGKGMMQLNSIIFYLCYFYWIVCFNRYRGGGIFLFFIFGLILFFKPVLKNRKEKQSLFFDLFRHSFVFKKLFYNHWRIGNNRFELMNLRC